MASKANQMTEIDWSVTSSLRHSLLDSTSTLDNAIGKLHTTVEGWLEEKGKTVCIPPHASLSATRRSIKADIIEIKHPK